VAYPRQDKIWSRRNRVKKHERIRTTQRGRRPAANRDPGSPIHISNVQVVDGPGQADAARYRIFF